MGDHDRLAMLYMPQLQFSVEGDPLIKIGLIEGEEVIRFTPSAPVRVLPLGEGGPEITLPAGHEYTVERVEGRPGTYRYWATVARGLPSERDHLVELETDDVARGLQAVDGGKALAQLEQDLPRAPEDARALVAQRLPGLHAGAGVRSTQAKTALRTGWPASACRTRSSACASMAA